MPTDETITFNHTYPNAVMAMPSVRVTTGSGAIVNSSPTPLVIQPGGFGGRYTSLATGPSARSHAAITRSGDFVYLVGGLAGGNIVRDAWRYTISLNQWEQIPLVGSTAIIYRSFALFFVNNRLILAGGSTGAASGSDINNATSAFAEINLQTNAIRAISGALAAQLGNIIGYGINEADELYLWGGTNRFGFAAAIIDRLTIAANGNSISDQLVSLSPAQNTVNATTLLIGSEIFTYYGASDNKTVWRLTTGQTAPTAFTHTLADTRLNGIAGFDADSVWFFSGDGDAETALRMNRATNEFTAETVSNIPSVEHSAFVASLDETFVFGGVNGGTESNAFGVIR